MKLLKNTFLFCALFIGLLNNSIASQHVINEANTLMKKSAMAENQEQLNTYLHDFKTLTSKNKNNDSLKKMYANTLASTGKYKEAYIEYKQLNNKQEDPNFKTLECMLLEKTDGKNSRCYQEAIYLYEKNHVNDINYLIALILGEAKTADDKKSFFLKNNKINESEEHILSITREEYIHLILP